MAEVNEIISKQAIKGILDTDAAIKKVDEDLKKLIKTIESNNDILNKNTASTKNLNTARNNSVKTQKKLDIATKEAIKLDNQLKRAEVQLTAEYIKNKKEVIRKTEAVKRQNKALRDQVNAEAGVKRSSRGLTSVFKQQAKALLSVAAGFLGIMTVIRVFKDVTNRIRAFDKAMQNMAGIAGESREELKQVERTIKSVAGASIKTSNEVAELATTLFTLGKTKNEVIQMLKPVNDLSIALQSTSEETADFLGQTLNAFGEGAGSAQRFADIIANIRSSTALDFERIKEAFGFIAPTADALGISVGRTGALIGVLQDNGIKAARAGRLLNSSFGNLVKNGLTLEEALSQINNSTNKVKTSVNLFGKQSFTLGLILASNIEKTNKLADEFDNLSEGSLKKLTDEQLKSIDAQLKILDSTWEKFILRVDSGRGVIGFLVREFVDLGIAVLGAGKSFADIAIETSMNATSDAVQGLRNEVDVVSKSLQEGGVDALDANKRAVDLLILQYLKLQAEAGGVNDQINAQVDLLKELQAEYVGIEEPIQTNIETNQKLIDGYVKQAEALGKVFEKEEALATQREEAKQIASDEENEKDFEAELEEDFQIELNATQTFLDKKARMEADDFLRKEDLALAEVELEERKRSAKFATLAAIRSIFGQESLIGKAATAAQRVEAIRQNLISLGVIGVKQSEGIAKSAAAAPFPLNIPLIAGSVAQFVSILALFKKAKKFKDGTKGKNNTPDTFITSEAGAGVEWIEKAGKITQTTEPTLHTGAAGSRVYSNPEVNKIMGAANSGGGFDAEMLISAINNNGLMQTAAIKNIKTFIVDKDRNIYGFKQGNYRRNYFD